MTLHMIFLTHKLSKKLMIVSFAHFITEIMISLSLSKKIKNWSFTHTTLIFNLISSIYNGEIKHF